MKSDTDAYFDLCLQYVIKKNHDSGYFFIMCFEHFFAAFISIYRFVLFDIIKKKKKSWHLRKSVALCL